MKVFIIDSTKAYTQETMLSNIVLNTRVLIIELILVTIQETILKIMVPIT